MMANEAVYHVTRHRRLGVGWQLAEQESGKVVGIFMTAASAVASGRELTTGDVIVDGDDEPTAQ